MKKVLLISYYYPPGEEIGGRRAYGLVNNLPLFGWEVYVLTAAPMDLNFSGSNKFFLVPLADSINDYLNKISLSVDEFDNITIFKKIPWLRNFIVTLGYDILFFPDPQKKWFNKVLHFIDNNIDITQFDTIITTSKPETAHLIGRKIKEIYGIPWIADYRDLWSSFHFYQYSRLRKIIDYWLERKTMSRADAVITISPGLQEELKKILHRDIYCIFNGFNEKEINLNPINSPESPFVLLYTGTIYHKKQNPSLLFQAMEELITEGHCEIKKLQIHFYGNILGRNKTYLIENAQKYNIGSNIKIFPLISHEKIIEKQRNCQILLFLDWNDARNKGVLTGKIFEYLAAKRPILALGINEYSGIKKILENTQSGVHITDKATLKTELLKMTSEYGIFGAVQFHGIEAEIMKYSHKEMARNFAEVLDRVSK